MNYEDEAFGVMVEWKNQGPMIMESKPMTYERAITRMKELERNCGVIRVAMFRMHLQAGNETLIPTESASI